MIKNNSLLTRIFALAVPAVAFVSCEITDDYNHVDNNVVEFSVAADIDGEPQTRATRYGASPVVMLSKGGRDTLYLHASIDVNTATVDEESMVETRGVPVNTGNFSTVCNDFGVTAYTEEGKLYMSEEKVATYANGVWSPSGGVRYWPEEQTLHFYAFAPYSINGEKLPLEGLNIDKNQYEIAFTYTVPTTNDGKDAEAQPDIMFADTTCSRDETDRKGTVPLKFRHALAAVKFVAGDIAGCTINSITLIGLNGKGDCVYDGDEDKFTWKLTDNKDKSFKQAFGVKLADNPDKDKEQPITDKNPPTTFMMLPQQLGDAAVEVNMTTDKGVTHTLVGKLNIGNVDKWEAGKIYTYKISSESINWTYVFDVTDNISLPLGGTSGTYNVISYRYRTQNPSVKEPVAWSVTSKSGTETQYQTEGEPVLDILPEAMGEVIREFTDNGNGGGEVYENGTSYPIVVERTALITDWPGDAKLRAANPKGSPDSPYDLSTEGGTLSKTTANCYVVNAPGTYMLPLVYGNAIVDGQTNSGAYDKDTKFVDYKGNRINSPYLPTPDDATLVWSDGFYMFKDVRLSADKKYLIFTIDPDYIQQANAVVAVRDAGDNIMWSWHIWVTEHKINETIDYKAYENASTIYSIMPCNLGWVDGKMVFYNPRELDFEFTQDKTGTQKPMKLTQAGAKLDYRDIGSTYYQWGRKDPIVALKNRNELGVEDYRPMETPIDAYQYKVVSGLVDMKDAIRHPNIYYTERKPPVWGDPIWLESTSFTNKLWDADGYSALTDLSSIKTVYDPSPRGFKVPFPYVFAGFVYGSTGDGSNKQDPASVGRLNGYIDATGYKYHVYLDPDGKEGDPEIVFTGTGQRASRDNLAGANAGGLWAMDGVYFWTCTAVNTKGASYTFVLRKDLPGHGTDLVYSYGFSGTQAMARPVRCMKE